MSVYDVNDVKSEISEELKTIPYDQMSEIVTLSEMKMFTPNRTILDWSYR